MNMDTPPRKFSRNQRKFMLGCGLSLALLAGAGCAELLDVTSDTRAVDPDAAIPLDVFMNGLESDFAQGNDLFVAWSGMFVDELTTTFTTCLDGFDCRLVASDASYGRGQARDLSRPDPFFDYIHRPGVQARRFQDKLLAGDFPEVADVENAVEFARAAVIEGFSREWASTFTCTVAFDGEGPELTTQQGYQRAEAAFTRAIGASEAEAEVRQAALAGRARVRLYLGDDQGALSDALEVDPEFEFVTAYSTNTFEQRNRLWFHMWQFGDQSVGPAFLDLTIDDTGLPDPRVAVVADPVPAFNSLTTQWSAVKYSSPIAPVRVTSGDEAQYIIAEIEGGPTAVDIINEVRARHGIASEWEPSTGSAEEIRDKIIDERRRTLFLEGVRMADLRRYLDKFALDFFPQPPHPLGFEMGAQTCPPLPDIERFNNPGLN